MSGNPNFQISKQNAELNPSSNIPPTQKKLLNSRIYREEQPNPTYLSFRERVEQNPHLVSLEDKLGGRGLRKKKKKEIISYNANRDKLFIPKPERPRIPINIDKNLIEEEVKIVTADLGIQSDEINYVNPEKPYLPQKIGKDQGTQIMDGDLFTFDIDVQPLLTVIVGKTLEQSLNEIAQEDEILTLKETKAMYIRKNNEEKKRIRNLEDREIQKKYNNEQKKNKRKEKREKRKETQRILISRVMSKTYLKKMTQFAMKDLVIRGHFRNYMTATIKNNTNRNIKAGSEKLSIMFGNMRNFFSSVLDNQLKKKSDCHNDAVMKHREWIRQQKEEAERRKKEEEEKKIQEELARKERRRKRKIERIKKEIKAAIIDNGVAKGDPYTEEITEMDNNLKADAPYIGVYGNLMGMLLATLSIVQRDFYSNESLYSEDNIEEILNMLFNECQGCLNIHFTEKAGELVKNILKESNVNEEEGNEEGKEETIDINNLKTIGDLDEATWEKISEVLSNIENNNDYLLKHFIEEFSQPIEVEGENPMDGYVNKEFYHLIIKTLINMCIKASYLDHFNFIFDIEAQEEEEEKDEEDAGNKKQKEKNVKELSFEERIAKYEAICMIEMIKPTNEIINEVEFNKSATKKKAVRAPEFDNELIAVKAYQNLPAEHNVLLYDRLVEFVVRNKIFECICAQFGFIMQAEIETQPMFIAFNETYDQMIDKSKLNELVQVYHYAPEVPKEEGEEEEEQQ